MITPPRTPRLYSNTGVYKGIHYFLIFDRKHRLWVLVTKAVLTCTHNIFFEQNSHFLHLKIVILQQLKYTVYYIGVLLQTYFLTSSSLTLTWSMVSPCIYPYAIPLLNKAYKGGRQPASCKTYTRAQGTK